MSYLRSQTYFARLYIAERNIVPLCGVIYRMEALILSQLIKELFLPLYIRFWPILTNVNY